MPTVSQSGALPEIPPQRPAPGSQVPKAYPILLTLSTLMTAVFCGLYITKPVIVAPAATAPVKNTSPATQLQAPPAPSKNAEVTNPPLLPNDSHLPGEPIDDTIASSPSPAGARDSFEETNLSVQHVIDAETPDGDISRIILDVPVLYQSRKLRWTANELGEARELLKQLQDHQEKSRQLRAEAASLLQSWNQLMERSIPDAGLRADSPSLPGNQAASANLPRPAGLDSNEAIQLKPAEK